MRMKLIGAVMVMFSSCGIGFLFAREIYKRKEELEEQYSLLKMMLGDIRYTRASFPESVDKAGKRHRGSYSAWLEELSKQMEASPGVTIADIWKGAADAGLYQSSLTKEDRQRFMEFGELLRVPERENVITGFELYLSELEEEIDRIRSVITVKTKLYRSMGILIGIFIVVLFI